MSYQGINSLTVLEGLRSKSESQHAPLYHDSDHHVERLSILPYGHHIPNMPVHSAREDLESVDGGSLL